LVPRTFGFVGIDATLVPGPKRPFNFFGALDNDQDRFHKTPVSA
jgi:hypothetical protein